MSGPAGDAYIEVGADTSRADREFRRWLRSLKKRGAAAGNDAGEAFGEEFSDAASASMKRDFYNDISSATRGMAEELGEDFAEEMAEAFAEDFARDVEETFSREMVRLSGQNLHVNTVLTMDQAEMEDLLERTRQAFLKVSQINLVWDEGDFRDFTGNLSRYLSSALGNLEINPHLNADEFAETLRGELDVIEDMFKDLTPNIGPVLDEEAWQAVLDEIERERRIPLEMDSDRLAASLREALEGIEPELDLLDANEADFLALENHARRLAYLLNDIDADLHLDVHWQAAAQRAFDDLQAFYAGKSAEIPVEVDFKDDDLQRLFRLVDNGIQVDMEPEVNAAAATRTETTLNWLARNREVRIDLDLDNSKLAALSTTFAAFAGARVLGEFNREIMDSIRNMDTMLPRISVVSTALGNLASVGTAAVGSFVSLGRELGQISALGLLFPAFATAGLTAFGVIKTSMKDMGVVLEDLGQSFQDLQDAVSASFWGEAEDAFRAVHSALMPMANEFLPRLAEGYGRWADAIADAVTSADGLADIRQFFENMVESTDIAADGMGDLADALLTLLGAGSEYLPRFAAGFNEMMASFAAWANEAVDSGKFFEWVDRAIENFGSLMRVIGNGVGIFSAFADAAQKAGGPTLANLADWLGQIRQTLESPVWQDALVSYFQSSYAAMSQLSGPLENLLSTIPELTWVFENVTGAAAQTFGALLDGAAAILRNPVFQGGLVALFEGVRDAMFTLLPYADNFAEKLGKLLELAGVMAREFSQVFAAAFEYLGPIISEIVDGVIALVPVLSNLLVGAIGLVGPLIAGLVTTISAWVQANPELASTIGLVVGGVLALAPLLVPVINGFLGIAGSVAAVVLRMGGFAPLFETVIGVFSRFAGPVGLVVGGLALLAGGFIDAVTNSVTFRENMRQAFEGVRELAQPVLDFFTAEFFPRLGELFGSAGEIFGTLGAALAEAFGLVTSIVGSLLGLLAPLVTVLIDTISPAFGFFADSVVLAFQTVTAAVQIGVDLVLGILNVFNELLQGNWSGAWDALLLTVQTAWENILAFLGTIGELAVGVVTGAFGVLVEWWNNFWNGTLGQGIIDWWNGIVAWATGWGATILEGVLSGWAAFTEWWNTTWSGLFTGASTAWTDFWGGLSNLASTGWETFKTWASESFLGLGQTMYDGFTGAGERMLEAVDTFMSRFSFWEDMKENGRLAFEKIVTLVSDFQVKFGQALDTFTEFVRARWESALEDWNTLWGGFWNGLMELKAQYLDPLAENISNFWTNVSNTFDEKLNLVKNLVSDGMDAVSGFFDNAINVIETAWEIFTTFISDKTDSLMTGLNSLVESGLNRLSDFWDGIISDIRTLMDGFVNWLRNDIGGRITDFFDFVNGKLDGLKRLWDQGWQDIKNAAGEAIRQFVEGVGRGITDALGRFQNLPDDILGALGSLDNLLVGAAGDIMSGFLTGLTNGFKPIMDTVSGWAQWIRDNKGPKAYDLALLVDNGKWIASGLGVGLERGFEDIKDVVRAENEYLAHAWDGAGTGLGEQIASEIYAEADVVRRAADAMTEGMVSSVEEGLRSMTSALDGSGLNGSMSLKPAVPTSSGTYAGMYPLEGGSGTSTSTLERVEASELTVNLSVSLQELSQLKDLESFLNMVQVRSRQMGK